jgi:hypothetical protein
MFETCDTKRGAQLGRILVMVSLIVGLIVFLILDLTSTTALSAHRDWPAVLAR